MEQVNINVTKVEQDVTINATPNVTQIIVTTQNGGGTQNLNDVLSEGNETDGENIFISNGDEITFDNGSRIRKGLTDAGNGGAKGVALVCSLDYELKWEAGRQYVMQQDGFTIREVSHNFTITPSATDDSTKGFAIDSRWILDNGDVYVCTDATEDSAVWELQVTQVNSDWNATSGVAEILNKPTIPSITGLVAKSDYTPAHSLLVQQNGTGNPTSVAIGNNEILGRLSGGGSDIEGLSKTQVKTLLDLSGTNTGDNATNTTSNAYADAKVTNAIVDGVTTIAPSQNAVFNALATKQNILTNPITGTGTSGQVAFFNGATTQAADNGLFWDNTNKRLGVGTTTPSTLLNLYGSSGIMVDWNNTGSGKRTALTGRILGVTRWELSTIGVDDFAIDVNGSERMRITDNGSVGIGTTTPTTRLDVRAQGALSTDIAFRVRNSADTANLIQVNGLGGVEINSTTQGVLFPRMTTTQKNAIVSPASGLVIYDTTLNKLCVRGASAWETITSI
jgi:hypothetical protein